MRPFACAAIDIYSYEARTATTRGLLRLEAEQAWVALAEQLQLPLTIFRLGGACREDLSVLVVQQLLCKERDP